LLQQLQDPFLLTTWKQATTQKKTTKKVQLLQGPTHSEKSILWQQQQLPTDHKLQPPRPRLKKNRNIQQKLAPRASPPNYDTKQTRRHNRAADLL
jgi:hypothetical protein